MGVYRNLSALACAFVSLSFSPLLDVALTSPRFFFFFSILGGLPLLLVVCLLLQIALKSMQQIQMRQIVNANPAQEAAMLEQALSLCTRCLSYDFIGTNPDESSEDVGTIQVTCA